MESMMISSRQIVELIEDEITLSKNEDVIKAFKKIIDRIVVLEDIEMGKMFKDFMENEESERKKTQEARVQAENAFKSAFSGDYTNVK